MKSLTHSAMKDDLKLFITCMLIILGISSASAADLREFKDTEGNVIRAELLAMDGTDIQIRREDGRVFTFSINLLCPEDRDYARKWQQEQEVRKSSFGKHRDFDVFVGLERRDNLSEIEDYDDRTQSFSPTVKIRNGDFLNPIKGIRGTLIVLGESVIDKDVKKVLLKESFQMDVPKSGEHEWRGKDIQNEYDDEDYAQYGYKYDGYIIILQNLEDDIVYFKASSTSWRDQDPRHYLKLEVDQNYNRTLAEKARDIH